MADAAPRPAPTPRTARVVHAVHELIVVGADNGKLEAHYRTLMNQLAYARLVRVTLAQPGRIHESDHEHHQVLDLIQAKDGNGAERMMREHVRRSHQALLAGWDAEEDIASPGTPPQGVGGTR
ncbi:FCD domain-containing protein [Streptomyces olivaceus]|uniref:FCD domain-containing protein n=1 Tax=Streptomyces olivaceus TaxID=47716 RepID=UPI003669E714